MLALWLSAGLALHFTACTAEFDDINRNPFHPTDTDIGPLFNTVVASLRLGWNEQFYLHNETLYPITQQAARTGVGFDNITIGTEEVWTGYYRSLAHLREIERRLEASSAADPEAWNNVRSQVKVLKAYKTFRMTDLFGDIPFFNAAMGFEDIDRTRPPFDSQEDIYKHLLAELAWVEENIRTTANPVTAAGTPYVSLGAFDTFLNGDLSRWRKLANALRLRHSVRMAEKDPAHAFPIIADILGNQRPLIREGEDVCLWPRRQGWTNEGLNWSFSEHNKLRMGTTVWQSLSESDLPDGSGIFDPRAYLFFETNNAGEWVAFPQAPTGPPPPEGGIPYGRHRDNNFPVKGQGNLFSPFNYYLVRDDQDVPEVILTAAEVHFLEAEAHLRGLGVAPDPDEAEGAYTLGLVSSCSFWQSVMAGCAGWIHNRPPILSQGELFAVANHPRLSIFTQEDKLALIYRQRWLDAFRQPWEAFSLWRRTGATPRTGAPPVYYRFAYPPSEAANNPEHYAAQLVRMTSDSPATKVWWMP
ncbi:MAG: hypothetical protein RLY31_3175 [Bacteroidota bacterium]